jgi:DNA-binding MarR family transcriptional regulator/GNAT superfamily N-acetyltransferase
MTDDLAGNVATVRSFSRFYTRLVGLLDEGMHALPYTMTEARVLFELGQQDETDLAQLRSDLAIDSGYMTRIVSGLQARDLVAARKSATDGRRQVLALTAAGSQVFDALDQRSTAQVAALLEPLDPAQRHRVACAMEDVRSILAGEPSPARSLTLRAPRPGDFGWVVARHGEIYTDEFGWDNRFEALVARIMADYVDTFDSSREAGWIAEIDGKRVGCIFCVAGDAETARLRLLLVDPSARGMGVGQRLVEECIQFAKSAGYARMVLWTIDELRTARRVYERAGFTLSSEEPIEHFGHQVMSQTWSLDLTG